MHITRIELENIKSHVETSFDFPRGTTAITGENGAGKTTLIEAVGWTLFDVLDYKKEEFLRRGAKRGVVRVTFESSLDERPYTVYRDTGTGYNVYDPQLKRRLADKKEEVSRFLWQHLGVEPGTDLDSLFRRAIGVPQGTFTAVFLETAAERKRAFDKLLKVEEYRRGAEELLKTARYIDNQTATVRERIARAEGEIARLDTVDEEYRTVVAELTDLTEQLGQATTASTERVAELEAFEKAETELATTRATLETHKAEQAKLHVVRTQQQLLLGQSRAAASKLAEVRSEFERHSAAVLRIKELERERTQREKLRSDLAKVDGALVNVRSEQKYSQEGLERATKAKATIAELKRNAETQERLETEVAKLRDAAARARAIGDQIKRIDERLERLRENYRDNSKQLADATSLTERVNGLATLEKRDAELVRELASLNAALERDERFQKEIKDGLCPILSQKCLNLKEGETLDDFVTSQFTELRTRIAVLETEHGQIAIELKMSREAEKFLGQLSMLQSREKELKDEGTRFREDREALQKQLDTLPGLEGELTKAEASLRALDNPKGKIGLLEADAQREQEIRRKLTEIESNLERLESDRQILIEQLELHHELDEQWAEQIAIRDTTSDANRTYLVNESMASLITERETLLATAEAEIVSVEKLVAEAQEMFAAAERAYDRDKHVAARAALVGLQKKEAELNAMLDASRRREVHLSAELARLSAIRDSLKEEFRERDRLEKMSELTTFIRDTLKEAAPLVARNYVYHVSAEANQMFREITGNAEHTLKWAEDYGIVLEEGGYERPFSSMSGGEQMAAAISVRLALLKQLTDIRLAFFDEPTTNMDAERRENLAQQLSQIKHFDQLFVISHDDTFEGYVDNVVTVERGEMKPEEAAEAQASLI
ncbi:MAG TPA: SMC family ATPase [Pyrinomonadaceae bacterium]|nr:SMC family ATPase [Pyrinomonadaceae bacterium]